MQPAIEIRNLGKQYPLVISQPYIALRDVISNSAKNFLKPGKKAKEKFWALQDINLDIMPGERVGIIGRNGAGKSTLLKIISRITPPTTGHATIRGRVGSLLEVGTGFHPELTGRENIFLNGSILGLKKIEIEKQLDAIIDFSGVEKFIDTPLKHFSSGMQLRLAFAVAAHLEPEILLIDEVLAVGDAEFQKKCIGKMEEVSKLNGRTILFVSHQLDSLAKLCTKGIWIENGQLNHNGDIQNTIELYTKAINDISPNTIFERKEINDNHLFKYALLLTPVIQIGDDIKLKVHLSDKYKGRRLVININLYNSHGDLISHIINEDDDFSTENLSTNIISVNLKNVAVPPGKYFLSFWAGFDMLHGIDEMNKAISFTISDQQHFTKRIAPFPTNSKIILKSEWLAD